MDSDAEHIYNPNLIIGSLSIGLTRFDACALHDLSLRSNCDLFSHQLLLSGNENLEWGNRRDGKEIIGTQKWIHKSRLIRQNNYGHLLMETSSNYQLHRQI